VRNSADSLAYSAERTLKDLGDKVPSDLKKQVEDKVAKVREVMGNEDVEVTRRAVDELNQVLQQVGTAAYQQAGPAAEAPGAETEPPPDSGPAPEGGEDVVDGEFHSA
jgi:molecular chaperone DnaK